QFILFLVEVLVLIQIFVVFIDIFIVFVFVLVVRGRGSGARALRFVQHGEGGQPKRATAQFQLARRFGRARFRKFLCQQHRSHGLILRCLGWAGLAIQIFGIFPWRGGFFRLARRRFGRKLLLQFGNRG